MEEFIDEYYRIKPKSPDEYDAKRAKGAKSWQTVRARCNQKSWRGLLRHLKLTMYFDMHRDHIPMEFEVLVKTDVDLELL